MKRTIKKIKVDFGNPSSGWLSVQLKIENYELEFISSNIPVDPIEQLIEGLFLLLNGFECEVFWNFEPDGYIFHFVSNENLVELNFFLLENEERFLMKNFEGNIKEIVLPFYRALRKFETFYFKESDWKKIEVSRLERLKNEIDEKINKEN